MTNEQMDKDWRDFWNRLLWACKNCWERDALRENKKEIEKTWVEAIGDTEVF